MEKSIEKSQEIADKIIPVLQEAAKLFIDLPYLKEFENTIKEKISMNQSASVMVYAVGGNAEKNIKEQQFYLKRLSAIINLIEILYETELHRIHENENDKKIIRELFE